MKQHIRELLKMGKAPKTPTPAGTRADVRLAGKDSLDYRGLFNGDTYQRYCHRCKLSGIEPREFHAWLAYELASSRPGRHRYLDDEQRFDAMAEAR